ncbi:hypothetical protein [Salipiger marinus]|uniref:Uncharacterized protein n=1 Tax=Salipiger marinus TaxID=555512 RepID=A0A1G8T5C8_9RHOB|nr:hypothetical protein [Salipiger marinus]SDJ36778.1 hypothetical protein SAMN04487993_10286 [Salipiger marinus]
MIRRLIGRALGRRTIDAPEPVLGDAMLLGRGDLLDRLVRLRASASLMRRSSEALALDLEGLRGDLEQILGEKGR